MSGLQVQPEARIGFEIATQADRRIGTDIARSAHDLCQAVGRDAKVLCQRTGRQAERKEIVLAQDFAGWVRKRAMMAS